MSKVPISGWHCNANAQAFSGVATTLRNDRPRSVCSPESYLYRRNSFTYEKNLPRDQMNIALSPMQITRS